MTPHVAEETEQRAFVYSETLPSPIMAEETEQPSMEQPEPMPSPISPNHDLLHDFYLPHKRNRANDEKQGSD